MREDLERLPDVLTEPFDRRQEFHDEQLGVHVMASIHPVVILEHALGRESDVRALEEALTRPTGTLAPAFIHRQSDLYDFWQTGDLCIQSGTATTSAPTDTIDSLLGRLRGELLSRVRPVVEKIIGRSLDANVLDYSAQCYGRHQYLLAHDDRLDSRRVAFVLYLVPRNWERQVDGGQLDFFPTDWRGAPIVMAATEVGGEMKVEKLRCDGGKTERVKEADDDDTQAREHHQEHDAEFTCQRYVPARNSLAFFEVTMCSHHQVAEVLRDRSRLSISGWFHDDPIPQDKVSSADLLHDGRPQRSPLPSAPPPAIISAKYEIRWRSPRLGYVEQALSEAFHLQLTAYEAFREADARCIWTPEAIFTHYAEPKETAWQKALMSRHLRLWLESLLRDGLGSEPSRYRLDWQTRPVLRRYRWRRRPGMIMGGESEERELSRPPRQGGRGCPNTGAKGAGDGSTYEREQDEESGPGEEARIEEEPRDQLMVESNLDGHCTTLPAPPLSPAELHVTIYLHGTRDNIMRLALIDMDGTNMEANKTNHHDEDDMMDSVSDQPQSVIEMRFVCVPS